MFFCVLPSKSWRAAAKRDNVAAIKERKMPPESAQKMMSKSEREAFEERASVELNFFCVLPSRSGRAAVKRE